MSGLDGSGLTVPVGDVRSVGAGRLPDRGALVVLAPGVQGPARDGAWLCVTVELERPSVVGPTLEGAAIRWVATPEGGRACWPATLAGDVVLAFPDDARAHLTVGGGGWGAPLGGDGLIGTVVDAAATPLAGWAVVTLAGLALRAMRTVVRGGPRTRGA